MAGGYAAKPQGLDWVAAKFRDYDKKIAALTSALGAGLHADADGNLIVDRPGKSIIVHSNGGITVIDPNTDFVIAYIGAANNPNAVPPDQMVWQMWRNDGTQALGMADQGVIPGHAQLQALQWFDRSGNIVLADDTISGLGLAKPYIPLGSFEDITPPTATTTSTSFVAMQWGDCYQQHPKVTASVLVQTAAGTTGEVRWTVGGAQIGTTLSIAADQFGQFTIPLAAWPSGHYSFSNRVLVQIEARVTGGGGAIGVRCLGAWGLGS